MTAFEEEMEEKDLKPEDIVQSLPRRKVRRMSVTRVAEEKDLRRLSVGFEDVSSIREILTDQTFSSSHIPPDVTIGKLRAFSVRTPHTHTGLPY